MLLSKFNEQQTVIGAYTDIPWSKDPIHDLFGTPMKNKGNSFIFKLDKLNKIIKLSHRESEEETYHGNNLLPTFGNDLRIMEDCNINDFSFSNVGDCYEPPITVKKQSD